MSDDVDLDKLFKDASSTPPEPSPDFLARVLNDGLTHQPAAKGVMSAPVKKRSRFAQFFDELGETIGGWPTLAGLATATIAGVYIGVSPPESLSVPFDAAFGEVTSFSDALDLGDGFDFTQYEG
jgi:hypothetical protein